MKVRLVLFCLLTWLIFGFVPEPADAQAQTPPSDGQCFLDSNTGFWYRWRADGQGRLIGSHDPNCQSSGSASATSTGNTTTTNNAGCFWDQYLGKWYRTQVYGTGTIANEDPTCTGTDPSGQGNNAPVSARPKTQFEKNWESYNPGVPPEGAGFHSLGYELLYAAGEGVSWGLGGLTELIGGILVEGSTGWDLNPVGLLNYFADGTDISKLKEPFPGARAFVERGNALQAQMSDNPYTQPQVWKQPIVPAQIYVPPPTQPAAVPVYVPPPEAAVSVYESQPSVGSYTSGNQYNGGGVPAGGSCRTSLGAEYLNGTSTPSGWACEYPNWVCREQSGCGGSTYGTIRPSY